MIITYTYKFTNKEELKIAIQDYPDNINIYSDCKYWDVGTITDMSRIFAESNFNGDIFNWDVSNVKDMSQMFSESKFNGNISKWDVCNVVNKDNMFGENT